MVSGCRIMNRIRDRAPPPRSGFQTLLNTEQSRREVERRWNRGRDRGPGPCGAEETGANQGGADETGAHQGGAYETGAHQGGAEKTGAHQGGADWAGDLHDGAGALQVGAETHGSDWDLGETETQETE